MDAINEILNERGNKYGDFTSNAKTTQLIKNALNLGENAHNLSHAQRESLDMIAHKMSRIVNGDANYMDSWIDIIGYAQLVIDIIQFEHNKVNVDQHNVEIDINTPEIEAQLQRLDTDD